MQMKSGNANRPESLGCAPLTLKPRPLQSGTIFGESLRQTREGERELTRHEVSQPESGGWGVEPSTDGNRGFLLTARVHLVGIRQEKMSKMWESSKDGSVKCTKSAGFHVMRMANMAIFIVVVKEHSV